MTLPPGFILGGGGAGLTYPGGTTDFLRADGIWASVACGGGLTVVSDTTLAAAATTINITGLDINTDDVYYYQFTVVGEATNYITCRFNGDANDTGYSRYRYSNTPSSDSYIAYCETGVQLSQFGRIVKGIDTNENTQITMSNHCMMKVGFSAGITKEYSGNVNLTQLTITCATSNGLGVGTRLRILKEA